MSRSRTTRYAASQPPVTQEIEQTISIKPAAAQSRVDTPSRATGQSVLAAAGFGQPPALSSRPRSRSGSGKRSMPPNTSEPQAKKQSKWSPEEYALVIELRGSGMKWDDVSEYMQYKGFIPAPAIADGAECDNNLTHRKVRYSFYILHVGIFEDADISRSVRCPGPMLSLF